ncbi:AP2/ERF domain [Macleaya cordata]|uniref:AP2/ERF domain n=1 Tax=Macleaya cordata TaxID=56857 RepID=A0A200PME1_MACCD|nr:AP2/ERF domain [Macleaya cordata]
MEVPSDPHHHHPTQVSSASISTTVPTSFFPSPSHLNNSLIFHGVEGSNNGFYSHLSIMPLKSDGSLCMMEALSRSQSEGLVSSSSPKLEDFLGGTTMATHHYGSNDRDVMHGSLNSLQQPNKQQQQQIEAQQNPYFFSGLTGHEMYRAPLEETNKETQLENCSLQLPQMSEDGIQNLKNWVARNYSTDPSMEHKMAWFLGDNGVGSGSVGGMGYRDLQSLSLSMSPGSQSSCVTIPQQISSTGTECVAMETKKRGFENVGKKQTVHRKSIDTFGQRTSQYRGVTKHRWTGRYEAHLWDNSCKKEGQTRKGRQGGYDMEQKAARAYDLAALKYWGPSTFINLSLDDYKEELEEMKNMSRQEYVAHLRRKSSGFSRGASMYRGVTRHHQHGRWQARIGRVAGNKDLYLGTFSTQEEAAEAYDIAAIKFRGVNAVTNFEITRYDVERIRASNALLNGELAKRDKHITSNNGSRNNHSSAKNSITETGLSKQDNVGGLNPKIVLNHSQSQEPTKLTQILDHQKSVVTENYRNPSLLSEVLHDLIEIGTANSAQEAEESLVTSLGSSREGSPDKIGLSMLFTGPSSSASKFTDATTTTTTSMSSLIPTAQLRPAVFAAWSDA